MPTNTRSSSTTNPKPRERSERRREQNRIAQKIYRDKKKRYLHQLESQAKRAAPTLPSSHNDEVPQHAYQSTDPSLPDVAIRDDMNEQGSVFDLLSDPFLSVNPEAANGLFLPGVPPFDLIPGESIDRFQNNANFLAAVNPAHNPDQYDGQDLNGIGYEVPSSHEDSQTLSPSLDRSPFSSSQLRDILRSKDGVSQKHSLEEILIAGIRSLSKDEDAEPRTASTNEENETQRIIALNTLPNHPRIPDLHMNTIHLSTISFVAACLANAAMLGLSPEKLWDTTTQSPFYQTPPPSPLSSQQSPATTTFTHLKPLLRPSPIQRTNPHHPYLDILPFPEFRNRIIQLLQIHPPPFDSDQLCTDLKNDGIICWGSRGRSGVGSGAPWDIRSWEVRPWFLRKWWVLFDGPEGEFWRHTRWWGELRGERGEYPWLDV